MIATLLLAALQAATSCPQIVQVNLGQEVELETAVALSSKTNMKGESVAARVARDVVVDGRTVIPKGTPAVVQILDARSTGGLGSSGRLVIAPMYLQIAGRTVRLSGLESKERGVSAGAVIGMALLTPIFSGRSAVLPERTRIDAMVSKALSLPAQPPC